MRSGMMRCLAPCSFSTPFTRMVGVPAPSIFTHLVQEIGKISDFRLAGAVLQNGFALGQSCGHEQIFSACDRDFVKDNFGAFQPLGCGFNESMFLLDIRPEALESFDMKVDWAGADGATARQ